MDRGNMSPGMVICDDGWSKLGKNKKLFACLHPIPYWRTSSNESHTSLAYSVNLASWSSKCLIKHTRHDICCLSEHLLRGDATAITHILGKPIRFSTAHSVCYYFHMHTFRSLYGISRWHGLILNKCVPKSVWQMYDLHKWRVHITRNDTHCNCT